MIWWKWSFLKPYLYVFNTHTIRIISVIRILYGDNTYCRFCSLSKSTICSILYINKHNILWYIRIIIVLCAPFAEPLSAPHTLLSLYRGVKCSHMKPWAVTPACENNYAVRGNIFFSQHFPPVRCFAAVLRYLLRCGACPTHTVFAAQLHSLILLELPCKTWQALPRF